MPYLNTIITVSATLLSGLILFDSKVITVYFFHNFLTVIMTVLTIVPLSLNAPASSGSIVPP